MRAYKVNDKQKKVTRFAGSQTDAKTHRDAIMEGLDVKKKDVTIEEIEIPTGKTELLGFLNELSAEYDEDDEDGGEETGDAAWEA